MDTPLSAEYGGGGGGLMKTHLSGTSRAKRLASRRAIVGDDWTPGLAAAWEVSRELLMNTVAAGGRPRADVS